MISLGSSSWGSSPRIGLAFAYEKQRSGADMQYRVQVTIDPVTGASYFGYPIYLQVTIDGISRVTTTLKAANPSQWSSAIVYTSAWFTVKNKTSGTTSVSFRIYSGGGSSRNTTYSYAMAVDPAASTLAVNSGTLGEALTLTLTRFDESFRDTVSYTCGSVSNVVVSDSTETSLGFVPPISLAAQNTTGEAVQITFMVETYQADGVTLVGTSSTSISAQIPTSVIPSCSVSVSDTTGNFARYGAFVQGQSILQITTMPTVAYGSPISTYLVSADGRQYSSAVATANSAVSASGNLSATAIVTDARGRSSQQAQTLFSVFPWSRPSVVASVGRCNEDGSENEMGAFAKATFTANVAPVENLNSAVYTVQYRAADGEWTSIQMTDYDNQYAVTNVSVVFAAESGSSFEVQVIVRDDFAESRAYGTVPLAFRLLNAATSGDSIAFGRISTPGNGFEVDMPATFYQNVMLPESVIKQITLATHPVGSLYWSKDPTSPEILFGGKWRQIKDRFILAAGDTYAAGNYGGEAEVTLTVDQIPSHRHNVTYRSGASTGAYYGQPPYSSNSGTAGTQLTAATGGGQAHNNMPPYVAYYCWERVEDDNETN